MHILVAGATGQTGRHVVNFLINAGHSVVALARNPEAAEKLFGSATEIRRGDVRDSASMNAALEGIHTVINTTGTRTFWGNNGGHAVDVLGAENLVSAAIRNNARHLILMSAFGLDRSSPFLTMFSRVFNGYFENKAKTEATHIRSGIPYTIVRPVELHSSKPRGQALLNQEAPLSMARFVSRQVVARVLVECVANDDALNKTFEVCESRAPIDDVRAQIATMKTDDIRRPPSSTPLFA